MAYATITDLQAAYSDSLLSRLAVRSDDPDPLPSGTRDARVNLCLDNSSGLMDSYFQSGYYTPIVTTFAAALQVLRNCCMVLTVADLVRQKGYVARSEDESLVIAADPWRKWLRDIQEGKAQIPGASLLAGPSTPGAAAPRTSFVAISMPPDVFALNNRFR